MCLTKAIMCKALKSFASNNNNDDNNNNDNVISIAQTYHKFYKSHGALQEHSKN